MAFINAQPDALSGVYAESLLDLAISDGGKARAESVLGQIEDVLEMARADASLADILSSRVVSSRDREAFLKKVFTGRVDDLLLRFLLILNRKTRLAHLPQIAAALDQMVQQKFGRVEVDVFTADPLSPDDVRGVRERLSTALQKEVIVHPYTDHQMIGGVKFRIGDQLIDASISTRLRRMRDQLNTRGLSNLRGHMDRVVDE